MKPSHPQGISAAGAPPGPRSKRRTASGNSAPAWPRDARSSRRAATLAMIEQVQPTADHERDQQRAFRCPGASTTPAKVFRVVIIARGQRRTKAPRSPSLTRSMLYDAESDPHLLLRATAPRERKKEKAPRSLAELCLSSSLQGEGFCCPGLRSKRREPRKVRATT